MHFIRPHPEYPVFASEKTTPLASNTFRSKRLEPLHEQVDYDLRPLAVNGLAHDIDAIVSEDCFHIH